MSNKDRILDIVRYRPTTTLDSVFGSLTGQTLRNLDPQNIWEIWEIHNTLIKAGWSYVAETTATGEKKHLYHQPIENLVKQKKRPENPGQQPACGASTQRQTAGDILAKARAAIGDRAATRDIAEERSMARTVTAFNALARHNLSETDGWLFMAILKAARSTAGTPTEDDYIDGAAYFALAGESAGQTP